LTVNGHKSCKFDCNIFYSKGSWTTLTSLVYFYIGASSFRQATNTPVRVLKINEILDHSIPGMRPDPNSYFPTLSWSVLLHCTDTTWTRVENLDQVLPN
jgi:hypothetical protein